MDNEYSQRESLDFSKNKKYFDNVARKIDEMEGRTIDLDSIDLGSDDDSQRQMIYIEPNIMESPHQNVGEIVISNHKPAIDAIVDMYAAIAKEHEIDFDYESTRNIVDNYKAIIKDDEQDKFEVMLGINISKTRLVILNQLNTAVMDLISRLTSQETIQSLTISERVALLDRMWEYMDKVNNLTGMVQVKDPALEFREIKSRGENNPNHGVNRNREMENYIMGLLD